MFEFKTEFVIPQSGSTVMCWDSYFIKNQNPDAKLSCHGRLGKVIRKASASDIDPTGEVLGNRAFDCFAVLFDGDELPKVVHSQWLKVVEEDIN
mgnify:CR=1 FL=1